MTLEDSHAAVRSAKMHLHHVEAEAKSSSRPGVMDKVKRNPLLVAGGGLAALLVARKLPVRKLAMVAAPMALRSPIVWKYAAKGIAAAMHARDDDSKRAQRRAEHRPSDGWSPAPYDRAMSKRR
jgi:uncharacterized membrane protein YebE (DUF533 family)